jgi:hypothetical protein
MTKAIRIPMARWTWQPLGAAGLFLALGQALPAKAFENPTEREYSQAVHQFKAGRRSEAFGRFIALANRGDVDAARIALHLYTYGAELYGTQWDAAPGDIAYWNTLVRNSPSAGRPEPESKPFVAQPVKAKVAPVQKPRTYAVAN